MKRCWGQVVFILCVFSEAPRPAWTGLEQFVPIPAAQGRLREASEELRGGPGRLQGGSGRPRAGSKRLWVPPGRLRGGSEVAMVRLAVPPTKYFVLRNEETKLSI